MRLWRSSLESSSPLTAMGLTNLGDVQSALREYAAAKQSHEQGAGHLPQVPACEPPRYCIFLA